jgi:hypothetical protein
MPAVAEAPPAVSGVIRADEVYTLAEFKKRTGLSKHALRSARAKGLRVTYPGNRGQIAGSDWLDYLRSRPAGSR